MQVPRRPQARRQVNATFVEKLHSMMITDPGIDIVWTGPYSWPGYEGECVLPPIPEQPGVYLQTVEYQDGYLIYCAGITRRPVPARFHEHTRKFFSADYNILDIQAMRQGIRKEIRKG